MQLITPGLGLVFWMLVSFGIVLFILGKFAWKPILKALGDRESNIAKALKSADKAREEMAQLKADNEKIMAKAREDRDNLLKEAREIKDKIIVEARDDAAIEGEKLLKSARIQIEGEKLTALKEIKEKVAALSIEIAEKILRENLAGQKDQEALINKYLDEIKLS
jgi:F-type H+-transporting ATPase subunit b